MYIHIYIYIVIITIIPDHFLAAFGAAHDEIQANGLSAACQRFVSGFSAVSRR